MGKGHCFKLDVLRCLLKSETDAITTAKRIKDTTKTEVENGSISGIIGPVLMVPIGEFGLGVDAAVRIDKDILSFSKSYGHISGKWSTSGT